ncbi:MAG: TolC family protein, partial [Polyangiales bacterium]
LVERHATVLVPLRQKVVALSQQNFDAMLIGVYQLLLAKQNEVNAYRALIGGARDYWVARADLERAVGGAWGTAPTAAAPAPKKP